MRSVGTIEDQRAAHAFAAYLATLQIESEVSEKGEAWDIWVLEDDRLEDARTALEAYRADPADSRFATSSKADEPDPPGKLRKKRSLKPRNRTLTMRERWQKKPVSGGAALTFLLSVFCIIVTIMTDFGKQEVAAELIKMKSSAYLNWEVWRFFTPAFSHGDWIHLIFNLMWLYQLGGAIEQKRGTEILLLMTLVFASVSNSLEFFMQLQAIVGSGYVVENPEQYVNFHGFSGVNYGLFGYLWIKGRFDPWENIHLNPSTVTWLAVWYVVCLVGIIPGVANWAHTGGLVMGAIWGYADARISRYRRGMN